MISNHENVELIVPEHTNMTYVLEAHVTRIVCHIGAYAHLTVIHAPQQAISHIRQTYLLQERSRFEMRAWYTHYVDTHLEIRLQGAYALADVKAGFKGVDATAVQLNTLQRHEARHTTSSLVCKSLLADAAQTMHTGMIYVAPGAVGTDARLYSNHMLTGFGAQAYVQPNLEVLTDDVQCAHGSAIGMFDADMLFYMQSRGIDVTSAEQLLEEAFFAEVRS